MRDRYNENNTESDEKKFFKKMIKIIAIIVIAIVVLAVVLGAVAIIPSGKEGVLQVWGKATDKLDPGIHFIMPIANSYSLMNVQTVTVEATESAASKDLQEVATQLTVNYHVDADAAKEVFIQYGQSVKAVLVPVMQDSLKATTAKFNAEDLINNRDMAMQSLKELLSTRFAAFHVTVDAVSLTDFQFSTQFTQAIESKVTAQQNALAAQNQLAVVQFESQQQVIKAQAAATATVTTANAQANATVIAANAQAELQRLVNSQLTPEFLEYMKLKTWNGQLPQYMSGDNLPIWITTTNSTAP